MCTFASYVWLRDLRSDILVLGGKAALPNMAFDGSKLMWVNKTFLGCHGGIWMHIAHYAGSRPPFWAQPDLEGETISFEEPNYGLLLQKEFGCESLVVKR